MAEPTITCPKCRNEIKLTESLAAPLIESTRADYERKLAQKDVDVAKREVAIAKAKESLEEQIAEKLKLERTKIAADESRKAKLSIQSDFDVKIKEVAELQE